MEYHLKPLGKTCAGTGKPLAPGSQCISVVVDDGHELKRLDFSKEGWKGPPEGTLAQWQCSVPTPVDVKKRLLNPDALMNYFDQLTEEANPLQEKLRYILAILLMHKKRLREEGTRSSGEDEFVQFTATQGEGAYEVRNFHLSDEEVAELQASLNAHLAVEAGNFEQDAA